MISVAALLVDTAVVTLKEMYYTSFCHLDVMGASMIKFISVTELSKHQLANSKKHCSFHLTKPFQVI